MNTEEIRKDYPLIAEGIIYLDNTASTLTPKQVMQAVNEYYLEYRANIHRGVYELSQKASEEYDKARIKTAAHINASPRELIFNRNTTEGINQIALSLELNKGDKILTTSIEHHSNLLPWLNQTKKGVQIEYIHPTSEGLFDPSQFEEKISENTKLVAVTHISNVLGVINPVEEIARICREKNTMLLIDGAQAVPHIQVDVEKIGCDFYAFSGHKMLAPTGIGALYIRKELMDELTPIYGGGGIISDVSLNDYTLTDHPISWEAGTPNISGAIGLGKAVDYLKKIGYDKIQYHEKKLTKQLLEGLIDMKNIRIHGPIDDKNKACIVSYTMENMKSDDMAGILDARERICVRSGTHCAMPLFKNILKTKDSIRASAYIYNTREEIEKMLRVLDDYRV
ncbi:MAG: hypothetical protein B6U97_02870 [Candidatus Altiarchaeales archaeon ex4484_96]|nr:MAG: hypothetical protein B6U97_02870 [Candidatus Altiarchaeales archaeon ex4484_96]